MRETTNEEGEMQVAAPLPTDRLYGDVVTYPPRTVLRLRFACPPAGQHSKARREWIS